MAVPVNRSDIDAPMVLDPERVRRQAYVAEGRLQEPCRTIDLLRSSTACILVAGPTDQALQWPAASRARARKRYDVSRGSDRVTSSCVAPRPTVPPNDPPLTLTSS